MSSLEDLGQIHFTFLHQRAEREVDNFKSSIQTLQIVNYFMSSNLLEHIFQSALMGNQRASRENLEYGSYPSKYPHQHNVRQVNFGKCCYLVQTIAWSKMQQATKRDRNQSKLARHTYSATAVCCNSGILFLGKYYTVAKIVADVINMPP